MPYNDRIRFPSPPAGIAPVLENVVTVCRSCQSDRVTATGSAITDATYWRCLACGEIWNPSRTAAAWPLGRR
jgi:hypothetical protein